MRKHVTTSVRQRILERDKRTCQYCGANGPHVVLEIDHVLPRSKGGTAADTNLVTACFDCNRGKGSAADVEPPAVVSNLLAVKIEDEMHSLDALLAESLQLTRGG